MNFARSNLTLATVQEREVQCRARSLVTARAGLLLLLLLLYSRTGPRRALSLKLSDARVYEPEKRARLGTTAHFYKAVVLKQTRYHQPSEWFKILFFGPLVCSGPRRNPA